MLQENSVSIFFKCFLYLFCLVLSRFVFFCCLLCSFSPNCCCHSTVLDTVMVQCYQKQSRIAVSVCKLFEKLSCSSLKPFSLLSIPLVRFKIIQAKSELELVNFDIIIVSVFRFSVIIHNRRCKIVNTVQEIGFLFV